MSAYVCSKQHIQTIAAAYAEMFTDDTLRVLNILHKENVKSVNYRYDQTTKLTSFRKVDTIKPVSKMQLFKLIECLNYQSCEHDGWYTSKAYSRLELLRGYILKDVLAAYNTTEENVNDTLAWQQAQWSI